MNDVLFISMNYLDTCSSMTFANNTYVCKVYVLENLDENESSCVLDIGPAQRNQRCALIECLLNFAECLLPEF